ncbi:hypothetical protein OHA72_02510 [Dactylosporangium sp. NBC_01737]|uniref:hypothetical protein n=1 Tax=Dactylosporangium sp. NBC_01737 TaxID=2975959 RepID=UPI002E1400CD|nr:hypothetical protein OHA72_02510 [Dactylosporangium sp. NBC_01737]
MTEQHSPWAQPDTQVVLAPVGPAPTIQRTAEPPRAAPGYRSGRVSGIGVPPIVPPPSWPSGGGGGGEDDDDPVKRNKRILKLLSGGAVAVVAIGLIVILVSLMTGNATTPGGLFDRRAEGPSDTRPELARRCPPPTIPPELPPGGAEVPAGPRTTDPEAGISYKEYGDPWQPWDAAWVDLGELKVTYRIGQHFITEPNYSGNSDYHATILSGHVPAAVNDGMVLDLKCVGDQIAADVRISFYPKSNQLEQISAKDLTLGGRPARLLKFRLHFSQPGLKAKSELVSIALIDLGKPEAAILYVSIPDTHRQFDYIADEAPESVRPL